MTVGALSYLMGACCCLVLCFAGFSQLQHSLTEDQEYHAILQKIEDITQEHRFKETQRRSMLSSARARERRSRYRGWIRIYRALTNERGPWSPFAPATESEEYPTGSTVVIATTPTNATTATASSGSGGGHVSSHFFANRLPNSRATSPTLSARTDRFDSISAASTIVFRSTMSRNTSDMTESSEVTVSVRGTNSRNPSLDMISGTGDATSLLEHALDHTASTPIVASSGRNWSPPFPPVLALEGTPGAAGLLSPGRLTPRVVNRTLAPTQFEVGPLLRPFLNVASALGSTTNRTTPVMAPSLWLPPSSSSVSSSAASFSSPFLFQMQPLSLTRLATAPTLTRMLPNVPLSELSLLALGLNAPPLPRPAPRPPKVYWKLDKTENKSRMRMKLKINYEGTDHKEASEGHGTSSTTTTTTSTSASGSGDERKEGAPEDNNLLQSALKLARLGATMREVDPNDTKVNSVLAC